MATMAPGNPTLASAPARQPESAPPAFGMLTRRLWLIAAAVGLVMFAGSMAFDWLLVEHRERLVALAVSDALVGILGMVLVFTVLEYGRKRRQQVELRMEALGEVNHHIRNALQSLAFSAASLKGRREPENQDITDAINRIQWALLEILPKVEPTYEPFEGSARTAVRHDLLRREK
jgi:hypothetical protein